MGWGIANASRERGLATHGRQGVSSLIWAAVVVDSSNIASSTDTDVRYIVCSGRRCESAHGRSSQWTCHLVRLLISRVHVVMIRVHQWRGILVIVVDEAIVIKGLRIYIQIYVKSLWFPNLFVLSSVAHLNKRLRLLGIAAKHLTVCLATIVHRFVVSTSASTHTATTNAAVLWVLNDEVPCAMGCQCGPKQSTIVHQLALKQISTIGRRTRIKNSARGEGIRFGGLPQRIDRCLLDVRIVVREEVAERASINIGI